jgi:hypothetical protein
LLAASCIGAAAVVSRSHGDATVRGERYNAISSPAEASQIISAQSSNLSVQASTSKVTPPQSARPPQVPSAGSSPAIVAMSPEQEHLTELFRGFLAIMEQDIGELKTSIERLKASQEDIAREDSAVAEQLKAVQEQLVRDNAAFADQLKATQEQMARLIALDTEQQSRAKTSAAPIRPIAASTHGPRLSSPQTRAQPLTSVRGQ